MTPEDLVRLLAEDHPAAVILTDAVLDAPGPHILYVNPAFSRLTGYAPEEVIGRNPRLLQGRATKPLSVRAFGKALRQGKPFHGYVINHRKSGEAYLCEIDAHPIHDCSGAIEAFIALAHAVKRRRGRPAQGNDGRYRRIAL